MILGLPRLSQTDYVLNSHHVLLFAYLSIFDTSQVMTKGSEVTNILELTPVDRLFFTGPFTEISKTHITLKNATFKSIIFKV